MKKSFSIFSLVVLIFCSVQTVFLQERTISEQEINALKDKASKSLQDNSYRLIKITKYNLKTKFSPPTILKEITEFIPPDHRHTIYESKHEDTTVIQEEIYMDQILYIKLRDLGWRAKGKPVIDNGIWEFEKKQFTLTIERKYLGEATVNNQNTDLYIINTIKRYSKPKKITIIGTEKFWFDSEGALLKKELIYKRDHKTITSQTTWEYEYNLPNLKIETPIIKNETKQTPKQKR